MTNPGTITVDPVALTSDLVRCASVTPRDAGALDRLEAVLTALGFQCWRLPFGEGEERIENLYARIGQGRPNFCFAGHTDVVPEGDRAAWTHDPFGARIEDGYLFGRGAADMKGAIAAFVAAAARFADTTDFKGSISLLITGDEEGPAVNGTVRVLDWLKQKKEVLDHCLVGEPTNPRDLGQTIKVGRRGSLNATITVHGVQGHVAYPHLARNPIPALVDIVNDLQNRSLDAGTEYFDPSHLELTSVDVGNSTTNLIPARASARLNVRFNTEHHGRDLAAWIAERAETIARAKGLEANVETTISGEAFITGPGEFPSLVKSAVRDVTGQEAEFSTSGGTSDARFIRALCPVAEFGLISQTMHKVDECVKLDDIFKLTDIYKKILEGYFKS